MNRDNPALEGSTARTVTRDGVELLAFHGCGYLGLAHEPRVTAAATDALSRYGASGLASRATSGNLDLHEELEERLAEFLGFERALVVPNGYVADLAAVTALGRGRARALVDVEAHTSLLDAAQLAGLETNHYGAGNVTRAVALLDSGVNERALVLTDGVFSMAGRLAPIPELLRHMPSGGLMIVDDCHGVGVLGERGAGTLESFGIRDERVVLTGSLGKALGSGGGFVAGRANDIETIRRGAATFVGATALSPPSAAAAIAALKIIESEPERLERLRANTGQLHRSARRLNLRSVGTFMPVLRIEFANENDARRVSAALHVEGIFAPAMSYVSALLTSGPAQTFLRIAVTSEHTAEDIRRLEDSLQRHLPEG